MGSSSSKVTGAGKKGWQPSPAGASSAPRNSRLGHDLTPLTLEAREAAASGLTKEQRKVVFHKGTERPFSGSTVNGYAHDNKEKGVYVSAVGGLPLFSSDAKFESGTGWPSFNAPIDPEHIIEVRDLSIPFMPRTEVIDARSGAHLGHVFNDGPAPTGKRYCLNAAALKFERDTQERPAN